MGCGFRWVWKGVTARENDIVKCAKVNARLIERKGKKTVAK